MKIFRFFRKKKNFRIVMVVTAFFVIPGFVIWGVSIAGNDTRSLAAKVNRQSITQQEFYKAVEKAEEQYRQVFGENYQKISESIQIDKMVLDNLIQEKLLAQQYRRHHIRVSSREILDFIKSDPAFKDEKGQFSEAKFSNIMSQIPPEKSREIEGEVKDRLQHQKLRQEIVSETTIVISDADMQNFLKPDTKPEEKEKIRKFVQTQKEDQFFQRWIEKVKKDAKIEVFVTFRKHG